MSHIYCFLLLLTTFLSPLSAKEDYTIENQPAVIEEAYTLSNHGVLTQKANGFVYLDVSNDFINTLAPLLEMPGELRVLPTAKRSLGAHISVFVEDENIVPLELGQTFSFQVIEVRSLVIHTRDGLKKLWVIAVESPELEALRQSYGCSPKLKGHDFHITLGKQMPKVTKEWLAVDTFAKQNFKEISTQDLLQKGDFVVVEHDSILEIAQGVPTKKF